MRYFMEVRLQFFLFIAVLSFSPRAARSCLDQINTWRNEREQVS
jgi:hypothetical protein